MKIKKRNDNLQHCVFNELWKNLSYQIDLIDFFIKCNSPKMCQCRFLHGLNFDKMTAMMTISVKCYICKNFEKKLMCAF